MSNIYTDLQNAESIKDVLFAVMCMDDMRRDANLIHSEVNYSCGLTYTTAAAADLVRTIKDEELRDKVKTIVDPIWRDSVGIDDRNLRNQLRIKMVRKAFGDMLDLFQEYRLKDEVQPD